MSFNRCFRLCLIVKTALSRSDPMNERVIAENHVEVSQSCSFVWVESIERVTHFPLAGRSVRECENVC